MRHLLLLGWLLLTLLLGCGSHGGHWHHTHPYDHPDRETRDERRQVERTERRVPTNAYEQIGRRTADRWRERWRTHR
jgi:hypothetical protein